MYVAADGTPVWPGLEDGEPGEPSPVTSMREESDSVGEALPAEACWAAAWAWAAAAAAAVVGLMVMVVLLLLLLDLAFFGWDLPGDGDSGAPRFFPALLGSGGLLSHSSCFEVASFFVRSCRWFDAKQKTQASVGRSGVDEQHRR